MTIFHSIILGLVEGITEFLPISSTAHLSLFSTLLHIPDTDFLKTFEIFIQSGAMLALLFSAFSVINIKRYWKRIIIALIPTSIFGFIGHHLFKSLIGNIFVMALSLFIGGVLILLAESYAKKRTDVQKKDISNTTAGLLGFFQSFALFPGISRSGAMIIGGLFFGIDRTLLLLFTFLLGVPTIFLASTYDLIKTGLSFSVHEYLLIALGFVTAFISAFITARWILRFIRTKTFTVFGWYRIVLAIVLFCVILF